MKKWILAGMLVAMPITACAGSGCRVYEYAEMKDMTDAELITEIEYTTAENLAQLGYGNDMTSHGGYREGDKAYAASRMCQEQNKRLWSVRQKRPSIAVTTTYEQCVERGHSINLPEDQINQFCNKYKQTSNQQVAK